MRRREHHTTECAGLSVRNHLSAAQWSAACVAIARFMNWNCPAFENVTPVPSTDDFLLNRRTR
jgi:hypothetical protein